MGLSRSASAACADLAIPLAAASADFHSPVDASGGLSDSLIASPLFSRDIEPIFERRCSIGGCHSVATAQAGLVLRPGLAYDALVNVPAQLSPGFRRVLPSQPDSSWLMRMLEEDPVRRNGSVRMPLSSTPLTENQIATIRNWIRSGAVRN